MMKMIRTLNNSVTVQMVKNFNDMAAYDLEFTICTIEANLCKSVMASV